MKFLRDAISVARTEQGQARYGRFTLTAECSFFLDTGPAGGAFTRFPCVGECTNILLPGQRLRPRLPGPSLPDAAATRSPAVHHGDLQVPTHNTPSPQHAALPPPPPRQASPTRSSSPLPQDTDQPFRRSRERHSAGLPIRLPRHQPMLLPRH